MPGGSIYHILLVEDNPGDAYLIREMIAECDSRCILKTTGTLSSALSFLREEHFDAVLVDLHVPDSSGIETFNKIHADAPGLAVIVLTGLADEELALQALGLGAQDYLVKGKVNGELLHRTILYSIERKRADAEMQRLSRKTELILATAGEGILGLDAAGRIIFVNKAASALLGYRPDELVGQNCLVMFHHSTQAGTPYSALDCPVDAAFREGTDHRGEEFFWRKEGTSFPVEFTSTPLYEENSIAGAVVTFRDITDRRRAEAALRESRERFRQMADAMPQLVWTAKPDGTVDYYNKRVKEFAGFTLRPDGSWLWQPVLHPDDLEPTVHAWQNSLKSGSIYEIEHRVQRRDGTYHWYLSRGEPVLDNSGRIVKWYGTATDINDLKIAEDKLRQSKEANESNAAKLEAIIIGMTDALVMGDTEGNVVSLNPAAVRLHGFKNSEQALKHISRYPEMFDVYDLEGNVQPTDAWPLARAIRGELFTNHEIRVRRRDTGQEFIGNYSGTPVRDGKGNVILGVITIRDITESKRLEKRLRESEEKYRELVQNANSIILKTDKYQKITFFNEYAQRFFGYRESEIIGRNVIGTIVPPAESTGKSLIELVDNIFRDPSQFEQVENENAKKNGERVWISWMNKILRDSKGNFDGFLSIGQDITIRKRLEETIRQQAQHDSLTGLPNRRLFQEVAAVELAESRRHGRKLAIFYMDLDRFKEVNDRLGHELGDLLLQEAASRLRAAVRASDTVARIGGDEFNLLISDIGHPEYGAEVARKILEAIRKPFFIKDQELNTSTSIGISIFPDDSERIDELLQYADVAMYHAKEHGRNMFSFYSPAINTRSQERVRFQSALRRAIERDEFRLHFQPLVDVRTKKTVSVEALLRWQHPDRGLLLPEEFFEAAEDAGVMPEIEDWVLRNVSRQMNAWREQKHRPVCVTVNVSARQFQKPSFVKRVTGILDETGMRPECLDIEITEAAAMQDIEKAIRQIEALRQKGIQTSIDDFGTGCSSLNHLKRLPVQKLKIDRSFVRDIANDPDDRAIISAVTSMARQMGIRTVAEGVETEEQLEFLRKTGCDEMQGFLFSEPVPAHELKDLVSG